MASGAPCGTTTVQPTPAARAAHATAWPWLPDEWAICNESSHYLDKRARSGDAATNLDKFMLLGAPIWFTSKNYLHPRPEAFRRLRQEGPNQEMKWTHHPLGSSLRHNSHIVHCSSRLERARLLQMLTLEENLRRIIEWRIIEWSAREMKRQSLFWTSYLASDHSINRRWRQNGRRDKHRLDVSVRLLNAFQSRHCLILTEFRTLKSEENTAKNTGDGGKWWNETEWKALCAKQENARESEWDREKRDGKEMREGKETLPLDTTILLASKSQRTKLWITIIHDHSFPELSKECYNV